jgi:hypothetical protein
MNREQRIFLSGLLADFERKVESLAESTTDPVPLLNKISRRLERLLEKEPRRIL